MSGIERHEVLIHPTLEQIFTQTTSAASMVLVLAETLNRRDPGVSLDQADLIKIWWNEVRGNRSYDLPVTRDEIRRVFVRALRHAADRAECIGGAS